MSWGNYDNWLVNEWIPQNEDDDGDDKLEHSKDYLNKACVSYETK